MSRPRGLGAFISLATILFFGCADFQTTEGDESSENPRTSVEPQGASPVEYPDTTAASVWAFLTEQDYQDTWPLLPGKGKLYEGTEPHGMLLTTYVNRIAIDALTNESAQLPTNAIVVKENYTPDEELAATTVMFKAHGYDAEHNDWFWMKRLADGTVESSGRVEMCQTCHGTRAANDYIMTLDLQSSER